MFSKAKKSVGTFAIAVTVAFGLIFSVGSGQAYAATPTSAPSSQTVADKIIVTGNQYIGTPYQFGARYGQTRTFDCSSFVKTVYAKHNVYLPRSSRQQSQVGKYVPRNQLQKGDLVFFSTSKSKGRVGHVGIYAGNGLLLHTYGPGGVRYDSLNKGWLNRAYITAKRVLK
ncbi:C40 family peptidase [Numidum massiliense]|uniref:C40 family peptidase n=1 Tax=Numidum massiliense TaxID=1522315 RepID=UPI000938C42A|nr:C40 family peptidase [Numidum massiliense]